MSAVDAPVQGAAAPPLRGAALLLETTGAHCAAALRRDDGLVLVESEPMARGHAERLFPIIERLFSRADMSLDAVSGFAAVRGPGSFTGVRLGLAAVRGFALARGSNAVGIDGFWAIAAAAHAAGLRAEEVWVLFGKTPRFVRRAFCLDDAGAAPLGPMAPVAGDARPEARTPLIGPGAAAFAAPLGAAPAGEFDAVDPAAALRLWTAGSGAVGPPSPLYLRPPDAAPSQEARPRRLGPRPALDA
ncbi:MAG: tRNA (adenosine(37)-N6)-threonylcarbamoyltransferase complex dimerization subunit type 1 TsaB [Pseudomonadota bacterium]